MNLPMWSLRSSWKGLLHGTELGHNRLEWIYQSARKGAVRQFYFAYLLHIILLCTGRTPCNSGLFLETILSFLLVSFLRNELSFHIFLIYHNYLKLWISDFSALSYLWCWLNYFWFKQVWSFSFPFFHVLVHVSAGAEVYSPAKSSVFIFLFALFLTETCFLFLPFMFIYSGLS